MTVASYLLWFLGTLFTVGSIGGTALVARSVGAGRADEANRFCGQAFAVGLGLGVVALVLVQVLAPRIVAGDEPDRAGRRVGDPLPPDRRGRHPAAGLHRPWATPACEAPATPGPG